MNTDRLVLITGATGYVGTALTTRLARNGWRVRTYDTQTFGNAIADLPGVEHVQGNILHAMTLLKAMQGVTDVIHLSGIVTDGLVDLNHAYGQQVNVEGARMVAHAASAMRVRRFIYASSSSVYGHAAERADLEHGPDETVTPEPKTEYARQKLEGEHVTMAFRGPMTVTAIRSATCCGPAPRPRLDTVVNIFAKQAYFDHVITPYGGGQYRSNVHVDDAARLYEFMLTAPAAEIDGRAWNLTSGNHSVAEIAQAVAEAYVSWGGGDVLVTPVAIQDERSYRLDGRALERVFGWRPEKTIRDAAREMFDYFASGAVKDPADPIYDNTARMRETVTGGTA